jgi:hypothetical protein
MKTQEMKHLPNPRVEVDEETFTISLEEVATHLLHDQQASLAPPDGCISNPTGPTC